MNLIKNNLSKFEKFNQIYLVLASLLFSLMTVCVKKIDNRIPVYELVFFRSAFSLIVTSLIIKKKEINPWGKNIPLLMMRGLLGTIALLCIFYSIRNMPLSLSTVIQYTYPIFISISAVFLLQERLSQKIIMSLLLGWIGILIILNPTHPNVLDLKINNFAIIIAFIGSISTSIAYITVKELSKTENIFVIIKYFPLISLITLSPIVYFNWITPHLDDLIWIMGIGVFTQGGQIFLTLGLKKLPAAQASSINYLQVFFGSIWGIYLFEEIISINFIIGALFILLGTLITTSKIKKSDLELN